MGWMVCMGLCASCRRTFEFNPERVPSVRVNGEREPVCKSCINAANALRQARGLDPIVPLPGAYEPEECV